MPIYSICCGREVGSKEPKICSGCGQRVYQTTLKVPPAGGARPPRWNGIAWERPGRHEREAPPPAPPGRVSPPPEAWYPATERLQREQKEREQLERDQRERADAAPHTPRSTYHTEVSAVPPTEVSTAVSSAHAHPVAHPGSEGPLLAAVSPLADLAKDLQCMLDRDADRPAHSPFRSDKDTQTRPLPEVATPPPAAPASQPPDADAHGDPPVPADSPSVGPWGSALPPPATPGTREVEIVNMHAEPQYNGCRGVVVAQVGADEYLVRLHAGAGLGGSPWQGVLGGRGALPQHNRRLPWEEGDRVVTRRKVSNFSEIPKVNSLSIPGSFEIERTFHASNVRNVAPPKTPVKAGANPMSTPPTAPQASHASAFQSVASSNSSGRGPWEGVMGVRGRPPSQDGRDLPWGNGNGYGARAKSPAPSTPRASRSKTPARAGRLGSKSPSCAGCGRSTAEGGERPYNAYPLRSKSRSRSMPRPEQAAGLPVPTTMPEKERRRVEALRQRLAAVEGNVSERMGLVVHPHDSASQQHPSPRNSFASPQSHSWIPSVHSPAGPPGRAPSASSPPRIKSTGGAAAASPDRTRSPGFVSVGRTSRSPAIRSPSNAPSTCGYGYVPAPYSALAAANPHYSPITPPSAGPGSRAGSRLQPPSHPQQLPPRMPSTSRAVSPPPASGVPFETVFRGMLGGSPRRTASPAREAPPSPQNYASRPSSPGSPMRGAGAGVYDQQTSGLLGMVRKQEISMDAASLPGGDFVCAEIQRQLKRSLRKTS